MFKLFNWFGNESIAKNNKTAENNKTTEQSKYFQATPWLRLQIAHSVGFMGEYYVVQIMNTALKNPHWEEFSPRFKTEDEAYYYIKCTLMPHNILESTESYFLRVFRGILVVNTSKVYIIIPGTCFITLNAVLS